MTLLFHVFAQLPWFSFSRLQAWKFWFRSHIKNVIGLLWSLLFICSLHFQFTYRYTVGKTSWSLFIWHSLFVNMTSFYKTVMIFFWSSLWCIGDLIYMFFDRFSWHIGFMKTHWRCGYILGVIISYNTYFTWSNTWCWFLIIVLI
jgi:hypothetical protein